MLTTEKTNDRKQLLRLIVFLRGRHCPSLTNFSEFTKKKKIMSYNPGTHLKLLFKNLKEKKGANKQTTKTLDFKELTISGKGLGSILL